MIISTNWLKDFIQFDISSHELADILTMLGLEVEGMEVRGEGMDQVVVAVVMEKEQHPNADKLSLCKVNNGKEILNIVCGATNFKAGDKVALAQIGAVLPGDFKIKRSKIRGEESFGMLCSEKELGLADESAGIMILPKELPIGVPVFEALGLKDTILEIGLTPNRADCLSAIGIAREIAAKLGEKISCPSQLLKESDNPIEAQTSVTVEDPDLCPRYAARLITGCTIAPSPQWLSDRLKTVGLRSINNVVDVTNYVLMEYGHPLHAFDFKRLAGGQIIVRRAVDGEEFTTLDGQVRVLRSSDLTIRDNERVVALAGIMGGENSEISDDTQNILLESAYFNPSAIRLTSKRLGLHTESSHRFERGADIDIVPVALDRAASLIAELAGGSISKGSIDVYPVKSVQKKIALRVERINSVLGVKLSMNEVESLLTRLEFSLLRLDDGVLEVIVPSFRVDVEREIDLIEEIARLHGFENIPTTMPLVKLSSDRPSLHQDMERRTRNVLVGLGFNEVINFSFIAPEVFDKIHLATDDKRRSSISLRNPIVEEHSIMRTTLLPSLLKTVSDNYMRRVLNQRIFEMRRVYLPNPDLDLPKEPLFIAGIITGRRASEGWNQNKDMVDFFDLKGNIENMLAALGIEGGRYSNVDLDPYYHPGKACNLLIDKDIVGSLGELHPDISDNFDISQQVYYFELNFEQLVKHQKDVPTIVSPPRFPDITRDIAMLVDDSLTVEKLLATVRKLSIQEIEDVNVFDVYKGEHVPSGKTSIAIRIRYRRQDRTLTDGEVALLHQQVIDLLVQQHSISVR
jgi:phenylalanyl-tRNA synthetase beta chain